MALDGANYISELQSASPANTDPRSEGASQIRTVKRAVQQSFPNIAGTVDASHARMNDVFQNYNLVPGMIMMWSGTIESIPAGWAICDGEIVNSFQTPDLMGKFIKGASYNNDGTPIEDIGDSGGDNNGSGLVTLPAHQHDRGTMEITGSMEKVSETWNDDGIAEGAFEKFTGYPSGNTPDGPDSSNAGRVTFTASKTWDGQTSDPIYASEGGEIIGTEGGNQPEYFVLAYIMYVGGANLTA